MPEAKGVFIFGLLDADAPNSLAHTAFYYDSPSDEESSSDTDVNWFNIAQPAELLHAGLYSCTDAPVVIVNQYPSTSSQDDVVFGTYIAFSSKPRARTATQVLKRLAEANDLYGSNGCNAYVPKPINATARVDGLEVPVLTNAIPYISSSVVADQTVRMLDEAAMAVAMRRCNVLQESGLKEPSKDNETSTAAASDADAEELKPHCFIPMASQLPFHRVASGNWKKRFVSPLCNNILDPRTIKHIFAYGTLRIDDKSGASWTKSFNKGTTSRKGRVHGMRLFFAKYPFVTPSSQVPVSYEDHANFVIGQAVTAPDDLWMDKLQKADQIEGYPTLYQRGVVEVELDGCSGEVKETVLAFIYYRMFSDVVTKSAMFAVTGNCCAGEEEDTAASVRPILSGDFCAQ